MTRKIKKIAINSTLFLFSLAVLSAQIYLNPGQSITIQAEDVTLNHAEINNNHSGYTGSGFVNYINETGSYIEWEVNVSSNGPANCVYVFANAGDDRPVDIAVNGSVVTSYSFPNTGDWTNWMSASVDINLYSGNNTIRLTSTGSEGGPNIDRMDITFNVSGGTTGDVNGDGAISIVDALLVAQYYVGLNPNPFDQENADVNCDNSVNIIDALLIAQYYVGLIDSFSSCVTPTPTPTLTPTPTPTLTSTPTLTPGYNNCPEPPLRVYITTQIFTADASGHVFDGKLYVYTSHDQNNPNFYNMVDYHVFALEDDCNFRDYGEILNVNNVPWASHYMWAPDAAYKDGTYFFYFPAKDSSGIFHIGVATSISPTGPFEPEPEPIPGSFSIDPAVFVDDDGKAYMYFGGLWGGQLECYDTGTYVSSNCSNDNGSNSIGGNPRVVEMASNMKVFSGSIQEISIVGGGEPFFEGSWMHKYNGTYYFSYSTGPSHLIVYATGDNPKGPFTYRGVLLPNHHSGWTTHHSVVKYQGNWYLFYHDSSCSGGVDEKRCVKVADLYYNADGTIQTVSLY